jgi:hypothetical protein
MGIEKIRPESRRLPIVRFRARNIRRQLEHRGELEMDQRRAGRGSQDVAELRSRLVKPSNRTQRAPKIVSRLRIAGLQLHRLFEAGQRLCQRPAGREDGTAIVVRFRQPGIDRHGAAEQRGRVAPLELMRQYAGEMECARVIRCLITHGAGDPLGIGETAGAQLGDRGCEHSFAVAPGCHRDRPEVLSRRTGSGQARGRSRTGGRTPTPAGHKAGLASTGTGCCRQCC